MEFLQIEEVEDSGIRTLKEQEIRIKNTYKWICQESIVCFLYIFIRLFIPTNDHFIAIFSMILTFIVVIILFLNINKQQKKEVKKLRKSKIYRYTVKISDVATYSNLDAYVDLVAIDKLNSVFQIDSEYNKEEVIEIGNGVMPR